MIVELDAAAFSAPSVWHLDLVALIRRCTGDPHVLLLDPPFDPQALPPGFDGAFGAPLRDEILTILVYAGEAAMVRPVTCPRIRVVAQGQSDWGASPPRLTVSDAVRLLSRPLRILVENQGNDGAFLRRMLPPETRKDLQRWEREGFARIESEGGIGEMTKAVKRVARRPEDAARLWVLFDRDCRGMDPDDGKRLKPSSDAERLETSCRSIQKPWPLLHHMLERRAIENYLPLGTLFRWAGSDRGRRDLVEALKALSAVQEHDLDPEIQAIRQRARRWCFPMKLGLLDDVPNDEEYKRLKNTRAPLQDHHLDPLFRPLDAAHRERLRTGFGEGIAAKLYDESDGFERVQEAEFAQEVGAGERLIIARSIQERL